MDRFWMSVVGEGKAGMVRFIRRPAMGLAAAATLAPAVAGIGLAGILFWTFLLRPMPYPDSKRIGVVEHHWRGFGVGGISPALSRVYEGASGSTAMGLIDASEATLVRQGRARRVPVQIVTVDALNVLGTSVELGRLFEIGEDVDGAPPVVLVSHSFWRDELMGADGSDGIGDVLQVDGVSREVVGVLEAGTTFPGRSPALVVPAALDPTDPYYLNFSWDKAVVRLTPGTDVSRLEAELASLLNRAVGERPDGSVTPATLRELEIRPVVRSLREWELRESKAFLLLVGAVAALLGLLALATLANVVLAQARGRAPEIAVRRALGADSGRMCLLHLADAAVLSGTAGLIAVPGAWGLVTWLIDEGGALGLPPVSSEGMPVGAGLISAGAALALIPLVTGLALFAHGAGGRPSRRPAAGSEGSVSNGSRQALLAVQAAVATVLLVASSALLRSADTMAREPLGMRTEGVLTFRLVLPESRYDELSRAKEFHSAVYDGIAALPDVRHVGFGVGVPVEHSGWGTNWIVEGHPTQEGAEPSFRYRHVSGGYLDALGIAVRAGRTFRRRDMEEDRLVAVVNEAFVEMYWGEAHEALGKTVAFAGRSESPYQIVGVVGNTADRGPRSHAGPVIYLSLFVPGGDTFHLRNATYVVSGVGDPGGLVSRVRELVRRIDPTVPIAEARTLDTIVRAATAKERIALAGVVLISLLALLVGAVGLASLVILTVAEQKKAIAIRKAVGATNPQLRGRLIRGALSAGTAGVALGVGVILLGARVPPDLLHYEVSATTGLPWVATFVLAGTGCLAWLTSRSALSVEPHIVLKDL